MPTSTATPLYILDTNIWLDWLVFQTDVLDPLKAQHAAGKMTLIFTDDMLIELTDVIGRAQFKLSQAQQQTALALFHQGLAHVAEGTHEGKTCRTDSLQRRGRPSIY